MTKPETSIVKEATAIFKSETLLSAPVEEMTDAEALFAWSCLDLIEKKLLKNRKEELKFHLLDLVTKHGVVDPEKGHRNYTPPDSDGEIQKQCKRGKVNLDTAKLVNLLRFRGFDIDRLYTPVLDESKVEAFVALGEITPNEIRECSSIEEPTYALIVKKPSEVEALIPKAKKAIKK